MPLTENIREHFFLIPRILPYEGNNNQKQLFWLKFLNVRVRYILSSKKNLDYKIISVPWYSERTKR